MCLGEPYFEKTKLYPHYHRSPKKKLRRYESSSELKSNDIQNPFKRRAKRQIDYDPMAKHVEVLVAYDESIKEFHSDADIKSYILTLFSYVSFLSMINIKLNFSSRQVSHLYSDASIGNNIKIWLVKLVDLGKNHTVKNQIYKKFIILFCFWY
jgi:hypothetical protein